MMNYRILLLTLIITLAATACAAGSDLETAVEVTAEITQQDAAKPAAPDSTTEAVAVEENSGISEIKATDPPPTKPPAPTDEPQTATLPVIGPAPGWDNDVWINTDGPLPLEDLRGKVVLLEFWTFG